MDGLSDSSRMIEAPDKMIECFMGMNEELIGWEVVV